MKQLSIVALAVVLLAVACTTSSGLTSQAIEGGPGQPIVVDIAGADSGMTVDREGSRDYTLQIEVSDDSNVALTVTRISIMTEGGGAFQVQPSSRTFNEMIDPGKDHLFEMHVAGRLVRAFHPNEPRAVELRCIVVLSNGDSYFYTFEGPVRESTIP